MTSASHQKVRGQTQTRSLNSERDLFPSLSEGKVSSLGVGCNSTTAKMSMGIASVGLAYSTCNRWWQKHLGTGSEHQFCIALLGLNHTVAASYFVYFFQWFVSAFLAAVKRYYFGGQLESLFSDIARISACVSASVRDKSSLRCCTQKSKKPIPAIKDLQPAKK